MRKRTAIALAFLAGVAVALTLAYALPRSGPPGRGLGLLLAVLHPFLRLPVPGNGAVFAASIAFNGLYYAAAVAIATRLGRGFTRVAATLALIVLLRFALSLLFDLGIWLVLGEMIHS